MVALTFMVACRPTVSVDTGIGEACIRRLSDRVQEIGAQGRLTGEMAAPLGLVARPSERYFARQIALFGANGSEHYFSMRSAEDDRILLIRLVSPGAPPHMLFFVMDRSGALTAGGQTFEGRFHQNDIANPNVRADFLDEVRLWSDSACG